LEEIFYYVPEELGNPEGASKLLKNIKSKCQTISLDTQLFFFAMAKIKLKSISL
jgi:hypothetical protein